MRYIMMIKATKDYEAGMPPNPRLMAGMGKLSMEMAQAGTLLGAEGLQPSSQGVRIQHSNGKRTVTDGPFAETKELIGGYAILQAGSKAEAIELANRAVQVHIDADLPEVEIEIRPLFEPTDFRPQSN
jgi:hypothetical protein